MLYLLSPAKTLDEGPTKVKLTGNPHFQSDAKLLVEEIQKLGKPKLKKLLDVSDALVALNFDRYRHFEEQKSKQAALAYDGPAYKSLSFASLSADDMKFAQDHLRILTGLYGCLRPLDEIHPYRLDMSKKLSNPRGDDLYAFWGDKIAKFLCEELKSHKSKVLLNCASEEYYKVVSQASLPGDVRVVTCEFREASGRMLAVHAKPARGAMCRYLIKNRVTELEGVKGFTGENGEWSFSGEILNTFLFVRSPKKESKSTPAKKAQGKKRAAAESAGTDAGGEGARARAPPRRRQRRT
eukprot:Rmarinus@m.18399